MYALSIADDGRILHVTKPEYAPKGAPIVDSLPEGDCYEYRYVNGEFIHDPLPQEDTSVDPDGSTGNSPTVWDELDAAYQEGVDSL